MSQGGSVLLHNVVQSQASSSQNLIQCSQCSQPRFFKGPRGIKIHVAKAHTPKTRNEQVSPSAALPSSSTPTDTASPKNQLHAHLSTLKHSIPIVKRIPKGARRSVSNTLATDIKRAVVENTEQAWEHLLTFPFRILHISNENQSGNNNLTTKIKQNCNSPNFLSVQQISASKFNKKNFSQYVESKISEGDIKGAARILFSDDALAPNTPDTLSALHEKHPPSAADLTLPDPPNDLDMTLQATPEQVYEAVMSFRSGSAGGLDGLSPQHLKDLLNADKTDASASLLKDLTTLVNLMLSGRVNQTVTSTLYGANLCALRKKDGGIRPIAVGCTYRRLTAKLCCRAIAENLKEFFQPAQLGFGSRGGCEAAVHSLRTFLHLQRGEVLLKVDIKNAFNSVDRGAMLAQVKEKVPSIYKFLWQCYSQNSKLMYRNNILDSAVGCQQGDPLGPVIFSLAIHPIIQRLNSKFNTWYLDDGSLGGNADIVFKDLEFLIKEFSCVGLTLNFSKCELFIDQDLPLLHKIKITTQFNSLAPNIKILDTSTLRLLGSPIFEESFPQFIDEKLQNFKSASVRLSNIHSHFAFTVIKHCLFVPNFTYNLRCSHLWKYPDLLS